MEKSLAEKISLDEENKTGDAETTATESLNTSIMSDDSKENVESSNDFSEDEIKKAEEYKTQGNEFFKCKCK